MSDIHAEGMSELTDGDSGVEQTQPAAIATVRLLTAKYGLPEGSVYEVAGETKSGMYYALKDTQGSVHKGHEGRYWVWDEEGPIPSGVHGNRRDRSVSSSSSTSGGSSTSGKRKREETAGHPLDEDAKSLGYRLLGIASWNPKEYREMMEWMTWLENKKTAKTEVSSSSLHRSTDMNKRVLNDLQAEAAAREETATRKEAVKGKEAAKNMSTKDADSASTSGATVDRVALGDHLGWRAYEGPREAPRQSSPRQPSVFDRLGTVDSGGQTRVLVSQPMVGGSCPARASSAQPAVGGGYSARASSSQPYLGKAAPCFKAAAKWCFDIEVLDENGQSVRECAIQRSRGECDRPHDAESCRRLWAQDSERGDRF